MREQTQKIRERRIMCRTHENGIFALGALHITVALLLSVVQITRKVILFPRTIHLVKFYVF